MRLHAALERRDKDAWIDLDDIPPASRWEEDLREGVGKCDAFLFVISPGSVASAPCLRELEYAVERNKKIIPLRSIAVEDREKVPDGASGPQLDPERWRVRGRLRLPPRAADQRPRDGPRMDEGPHPLGHPGGGMGPKRPQHEPAAAWRRPRGCRALARGTGRQEARTDGPPADLRLRQPPVVHAAPTPLPRGGRRRTGRLRCSRRGRAAAAKRGDLPAQPGGFPRARGDCPGHAQQRPRARPADRDRGGRNRRHGCGGCRTETIAGRVAAASGVRWPSAS